MTENETIVSSTVETLIQEFEEKEIVTINLMKFNDFDIFDDIVETVVCSYIENEFDEGI
jgi:hypothetical protein